MTKEELLKPRIIAFGSDTTETFQKGEIFRQSFNDEHCFISNTGTAVIKHPEKYPHLFKYPFWYEERKASDMPEYVKDENGEVWKVDEYTKDDDGSIKSFVMLKKNFKDYDMPVGSHDLYELQPATEQEYNEYQNQKP